MLAGMDKAGWQTEITKSFDLFVNTLGVERCKLWGFRTPFLNFSQATFDAMKASNVRYDTSVEFGYDWFQPAGSDKGYGPGTAEAGKHYYWPFTMDSPFPGGFASKGVGPSPGMWEFPVYTFNKITGETASTVHRLRLQPVEQVAVRGELQLHRGAEAEPGSADRRQPLAVRRRPAHRRRIRSSTSRPTPPGTSSTTGPAQGAVRLHRIRPDQAGGQAGHLPAADRVDAAAQASVDRRKQP